LILSPSGVFNSSLASPQELHERDALEARLLATTIGVSLLGRRREAIIGPDVYASHTELSAIENVH